MSNFLSRDAILNAPDLATEEVEVPEWGGKVLVRGLTGKDRDAYEASLVETVTEGGKARAKMNMNNIRARLVAMTVVDERGKRLFTSADIEALGQKSGAALDRVFRVAQRLSGLKDGDLEVAEKNSEPGQSGDSTSA
ncbi:MAG: hypothetical protein ACOY93_13560 [Bacillota bacterium]